MHIEQNDQKVSINMIEEHSVIKLHTVNYLTMKHSLKSGQMLKDLRA